MQTGTPANASVYGSLIVVRFQRGAHRSDRNRTGARYWYAARPRMSAGSGFFSNVDTGGKADSNYINAGDVRRGRDASEVPASSSAATIVKLFRVFIVVLLNRSRPLTLDVRRNALSVPG
jgi:hypothetical protein